MPESHGTLSVPVSVKGIVFDADRVWLRRNERQEWELPGGKLECGEQPAATVIRELREELGLRCEVAALVDAHLFSIRNSCDEASGVLVLSYLCRAIERVAGFELVGEGGIAEFRLFRIEELEGLALPGFYAAAIRAGQLIASR